MFITSYNLVKQQPCFKGSTPLETAFRMGALVLSLGFLVAGGICACLPVHPGYHLLYGALGAEILAAFIQGILSLKSSSAPLAPQPSIEFDNAGYLPKPPPPELLDDPDEEERLMDILFTAPLDPNDPDLCGLSVDIPR